MPSSDQNLKSEDEQITTFAKLAREYCDWAEGTAGEPIEEVRIARRLLSQLYANAILLPERYGDEESSSISHEDWTVIMQRFGSTPIVDYWVSLDPIIEEAKHYNGCEMGIALLADDLADVWRDLKEALTLYDCGAIDAAVWDWRFQFLHHWGEHAVRAMMIIHEWAQLNATLME